jgi:hypothetical protein
MTIFLSKLVKVPGVPVAAIPSSAAKLIPVNLPSGTLPLRHHKLTTVEMLDLVKPLKYIN